jgi:putative transposase
MGVNRESARQNTVIGGVQLVMAAAKTWRRLKGQNQLPKVVKGVKFRDGIEVAPETKSAA